MAFNWTEETTKTAVDAWREGQSASQIARLLGNGVTRNAVIGKIHRLGFTGHDAHATNQAQARRRTTTVRPARLPRHAPTAEEREAAALAIQEDEKPREPGDRVTLMDLKSNHCRWPIGDPKEPDFHFCGRPKAGLEISYCEPHCRKAYQPQRPPPARAHSYNNWRAA